MQQNSPPAQRPNAQETTTNRAKGYAIASLCLLLVGIGLHLLAFFPILGLLFGCVGIIADVLGLVFLILVIATL